MKNFLKKKYKRLIALIVFLAMGCVGLFLGYAHFTADASGAALAYETEGKMENLSAVSSTYESNMGMSIPNAFTAEEILLHHYCLFESLMALAWRL